MKSSNTEAVKYTVDYTKIETGEESWTGILYPNHESASWAADNLRATRPDLKHIHVDSFVANP